MKNRDQNAEQMVANAAIRDAQEREQAALQKEREAKMRKAQIARADYQLAILALGLDEMPALDYNREGITPGIRMLWITPEEAAKQTELVLKFRQDIIAMGEPTPGAIVGLDGAPVEAEKKAEEPAAEEKPLLDPATDNPK